MLFAVITAIAVVDSESRISCGGNYGFFTEKPWEGKPCPPPTWEPAWELNRSTTPVTPWGPEIAEGNIPGFVDPKVASRWGWVSFDWYVRACVSLYLGMCVCVCASFSIR